MRPITYKGYRMVALPFPMHFPGMFERITGPHPFVHGPMCVEWLWLHPVSDV